MKTLRALSADRSGVTIVEFALVAPVLLMIIIAIFDLGHMMYTKSLLIGSIQKTARDSSLDGASTQEAVLDAKVSNVVRAIAPDATLQFRRRAFTDFGEIGRPEDFTDIDQDGTCDNGEPYEDANGNGKWDAQAEGKAGFGGARDAVLYTVTVTYSRIFPAFAMIGGARTATVKAETVLRNQPYGPRAESTPSIGNCA